MSDIKIQPSATGSATVTLTAPATGTARTVTLPDSTDTLAVNSDVTNKLPLAGGTMTGTIAGFTSTGIDDNATSTAITIDSNENVIFSDTSSGTRVSKSIQANTNNYMYVTGASAGMFVQGDTDGAERIVISNSSEQIRFYTQNTERLDITSDGRGLSQFTAKAWINLNGTGTIAINDSHNVSSITDNTTGDYTVTFTNAMANADYSMACAGGDVDEHVSWRSYGSGSSYVGTTFARIGCSNFNGTFKDRDGISAVFFGD